MFFKLIKKDENIKVHGKITILCNDMPFNYLNLQKRNEQKTQHIVAYIAIKTNVITNS